MRDPFFVPREGESHLSPALPHPRAGVGASSGQRRLWDQSILGPPLVPWVFNPHGVPKAVTPFKLFIPAAARSARRTAAATGLRAAAALDREPQGRLRPHGARPSPQHLGHRSSAWLFEHYHQGGRRPPRARLAANDVNDVVHAKVTPISITPTRTLAPRTDEAVALAADDCQFVPIPHW